MAYAHAALDPERLPWLKDERKPAARDDTKLLIAWGLVALAVVGSVSFWIGTNDGRRPAAELEAYPTATVRLPEAQGALPAEPAEAAAPEIVPERPATRAGSASKRRVRARRKLSPMERDTALPAVVAAQEAKEASEKAEAAEKAEESAAEPRPVTYWPASVSENAYGRVVRIGTFRTRLQAKRAWWKVVKVYPGMKTLKAVVAPVPSVRNGRTYYRLQFGTTSQAHSEILCQRMRIVRVPCSVVGLPPRTRAS